MAVQVKQIIAEWALPAVVVIIIIIAALILIGTHNKKSVEKYGAWSDILNHGESLEVGQALQQWHNQGYTKLVMQWDGNLVMYLNNQAIWASQTPWGWRQNGYCCAMQEDGNLVIYNKDNWQAIWSSGTYQNDWRNQKSRYSAGFVYFDVVLDARCIRIRRNFYGSNADTLKTLCG